MKNVFVKIVLLSLITSLAACSQSKSSEASSKEAVTTSEQASINTSIKSSDEPSSSKKSEATSDTRPIVNDQLSTETGFKVYFKAQGARIDKIEFGNKQIAKDGFTVGRVANRIANGKFTLNGKEYNVTKNVSPHSLHGGGRSWQGPFATANWTKVEQTASSIKYSIHSADGEEGYPGNMDMTVTYTLSPEGELDINYQVKSDKDTLWNPTNHLFMSLNGNNSDANHKLFIDADNYTPLANQIPTGVISPVAGTKFDYRTEIDFKNTEDYDDNYVLNGTGFRKVARLTGKTLGIQVEVSTDRAGLQLYRDKSGNICLETQMFPDMINHPEFDEYGSIIIEANKEYTSKTTYAFSILEK